MTISLAKFRAELNKSEAEETLFGLLRVRSLSDHPLPMPERQYHFAADWTPPRNYAADFAFIENGARLLVEVDGGGFIGKGHSKGAQMERDRERDALALIHGYRVLRCTPRQVDNGLALTWIERLLEMI